MEDDDSTDNASEQGTDATTVETSDGGSARTSHSSTNTNTDDQSDDNDFDDIDNIGRLTNKSMAGPFITEGSSDEDAVANHASAGIDPDEDTAGEMENRPEGLHPGVPTYRSMMIFIGTTILIWLSEPLLSLVDTTVVGQTVSNAVVQLASLGPATLLTDSLIYGTYFLAMATTNMMANASAANNYQMLRKTASQSLGLALCLGGTISGIVFAFSRPLIGWLSGASSSGELITLATRYSQIRCSVAALSVMGMVAQSICLSTLDTKTPALAVLAASLINIVGDLYLVAGCGMGIRGAAAATAAASVAATVILLRQVFHKMMHWRDMQDIQEGRVNGQSLKYETDKNLNVPFVSLPDKTSLMQLVKLAGPIFFVMMGKIICYNAMTIRATDFGMTELASHNIMMRLFFFFGTFGDSLSQASQTYLPRLLWQTSEMDKDRMSQKSNAEVENELGADKRLGDAGPTKQSRQQLRGLLQMVRRLVVLSTVIGLFNFNVSSFVIERFGSSFAKEPTILRLMKNHYFFMACSLFLHPFIMLFEGAIIASRDLVFLVGTYGLTMGLLFGQLRYGTSSFAGVWKALFCFQSLRATQTGARFMIKTLRKRNEGNLDRPAQLATA